MVERIYRWLNDNPGWIGVAWSTWHSFNANNGSITAAAIAYYALFSLFPLILFAVALSSFFIESNEAQARILAAVTSYLPAAGGLVRRNIEMVSHSRSAAGLLAVVSFLWSASGVFGTINHAVARAWKVSQPLPFWQSRLLALSLAAIVGLLLVLSLLSPAALGLLQTLVTVLGLKVPGGTNLVTTVLSASVGVLTFGIVYWLVPNTPVTWNTVWPGAVLAGVGWELGKDVFAWYLRSGFARFSLVYGSLGAVVALLLWTYLSATIVLLGAELNAAIDRRQLSRKAPS
jgi:membrane protein